MKKLFHSLADGKSYTVPDGNVLRWIAQSHVGVSVNGVPLGTLHFGPCLAGAGTTIRAERGSLQITGDLYKTSELDPTALAELKRSD